MGAPKGAGAQPTNADYGAKLGTVVRIEHSEGPEAVTIRLKLGDRQYEQKVQ